MADKTISELVRATQITATDLFVLEQNSTAKCLTGQVLINWMTDYADGHGGIQSLSKTSTSGLVDTYTITYADTTTSTFTVTNGAKGDTGAASYVWIRYAAQQPTQDSDMGTIPDKWIGIYSGTSATAPTTYTSYTWYQYKGNTGATGATPTATSTIWYGTSSSASIRPTTWSVDFPSSIPQGQFLWTKVLVTFMANSQEVGSTTYYTCSRQGVDGSGTVSTVNSKSPTSGNVQLDGGDINVDDDASTPQTIAAKFTAVDNSISAHSTQIANKQDAITSATATLTVAGWSNNEQTVSVSGVTASNNVVVSPAPSSFDDYTSAVIYCSAQASGTLTFTCSDTPTSAITVNVMIVG